MNECDGLPKRISKASDGGRVMDIHKIVFGEVERCKDCCCARSWKALGNPEYDGRGIDEHVAALREEVERLKKDWWVCEDCAFRMGKEHSCEDGVYRCPNCRESAEQRVIEAAAMDEEFLEWWSIEISRCEENGQQQLAEWMHNIREAVAALEPK